MAGPTFIYNDGSTALQSDPQRGAGADLVPARFLDKKAGVYALVYDDQFRPRYSFVQAAATQAQGQGGQPGQPPAPPMGDMGQEPPPGQMPPGLQGLPPTVEMGGDMPDDLPPTVEIGGAEVPA